MECLQPSRSFKIRGMSHVIQDAVGKGSRSMVSSSGGNAGLAAAYCCLQLKIPLTVFVPKSTQPKMIAYIKGYKAKIEVVGDTWQEAHQEAIRFSNNQKSFLLHPFEGEKLWEGHSTIIEECYEQMEQPDMIVTSVGGGGLLMGILKGIEKVGWQNTKIVGVETEGAASFRGWLEKGDSFELNEINTVATSLGAKKVTTGLNHYRHFDLNSQIVTDEEAIKGALYFESLFGFPVEPACGASIAAVNKESEYVKSSGRVLVVACGGSAF